MDHLALFSTPITVFDVPGTERLNAELAERLRAEAAASPGWQVSNIGGWHSTPDLARRGEPCFRAAVELVVEHGRLAIERQARAAGHSGPLPPWRIGAQAWAMVMRDGDYTVPHDHGDAHFSSAYYADAGDADEAAHPVSGHLSFLDPRRGGRPAPGLDLYPSTFTVRPRTGMLVIFPGWLMHHVHAYRGARPRVAISCNLTLAGAPAPA